MQKAAKPKTAEFTLKIPRTTLNAKERQALQSALKVLSEQSEKLGLLDPMEAEPATVFFAEVGKR